MDLSPRAKLGLAYLLSILIPGILTVILSLQHKPAQVWMWAPAGILIVLSAIDFCITNRKKPHFKKIFFGSLIAADLYFMTHIDKGKTDNPKMVLAFSVTSLFLFGSFLYIYNLVIMRRNEKEIEARFSGPPMQQRIDPHPAGIDRPVARNRTVEIFVDGESKGTAQLSPRRPDPIVEVLPEPEPDNRFARVLRDNYPL